jgi:YhcH/YjgK/YiaL family protein
VIYDITPHIHRYTFPYIDDVRAFLNRKDLFSLKQPEMEIRGRDLFVRIMRYQPKPVAENKFETHKAYADIQVVLEGRELMQVVSNNELQPLTEYHTENDYQFYKAERNISSLIVERNAFVVFFPGEAHRPSCLAEKDDGEVFKLVFKVRIQP